MAGQMIVSDAMLEAQAGEGALEMAVREHARFVYRVAYSVLRNHHDAEDATQETFLKILRYARKLEGVRDLRTWLARIAWRVALDRRKKMPEVSLDEVVESELRCSPFTVADETVLTAEMTGLLARLIGALPAQLRDVVTLASLEDTSHADIAEILDIPEPAVRSRLFRARQILKEKLRALLERKI